MSYSTLLHQQNALEVHSSIDRENRVLQVVALLITFFEIQFMSYTNAYLKIHKATILGRSQI